MKLTLTPPMAIIGYIQYPSLRNRKQLDVGCPIISDLKNKFSPQKVPKTSRADTKVLNL